MKMSDYDSDDAPDAVDFSTSKSLALQEVKNAAEAVRKSKEKRKEDRKKREDQFIQQKQAKAAKLDDLKKNAPTDDIFDKLPEKFERKQVERSAKAPTLTQFVEAYADIFDEELEEELDGVNDDFISFHPTTKRVKVRVEEHGTSKFQIMSSNDQRQSLHISKSVLNFRKAKTYGKLSKVKRESAQERAHRLTKLQLSGKNVKCKS